MGAKSLHLCMLALSIAAVARADAQSTVAPDLKTALRNGQHDFDWEIGTWKTELRRLRKPDHGPAEWVRYTGTTKVTPVWGGRANLVELEVDGPNGHLSALSLRLYNPDSHQWSLNF